MIKLLITVLWSSVVFSSVSLAGKIDVLSDYFETPGEDSYQLGILPEYKVERYVFPAVLPDSEDDVESGEEEDEAVLYRILRGPRTPFAEGKRPSLIQNGILCDSYSCTANKPQIAVAYLLVDQGYDVWLGSSNYSMADYPILNETTERERLENIAQCILITTQQLELLVMGHFNGSVQFYAITASHHQEPSRLSKWLDKIPGVKTVERWYKKLYNKSLNYLSHGYDRVQQSVGRLGRKLDFIVDNSLVRNLKNTVFNAWGIVSTVRSTLKVQDFSRMINHPDVYLDTPQLISKYGYTAETHAVKTEDGYLLSLHRISGGKKYPARPGKPVIFLQHGLLVSSAVWILAGPTKGLAYILADKGYDVWMGNSRGNTYSLGHVRLLTGDSKYWDFSFHEMGVYDLPASIDYILTETKQPKMYYLGHSQGTTSFFVMMSEKPEYNEKIIKFAAYAPMAYAANVRSSFIKFTARFSTPIYRALDFFNVHDFAPTNALLTKIGRNSCEARSLYQVICSNSLFMITGYDTAQINHTLVPIILGHFPAGSSVKQFLHFGQGVNSRKFRQFDYNDENLNQDKYRESEPPEYEVNNTKIPVAIFYATNDLLSDERDIQKLEENLPNVEMMYKVPMESFNHIDFMFAIDAPVILYEPTIQFFNATFTEVIPPELMHQTFSNQEMTKLIAPDNKETFHLIMIEWIAWHSLNALGYRFNAPVIGLVTVSISMFGCTMGLSLPSIDKPPYMIGQAGEKTFIDRMKGFITDFSLTWFLHYSLYRQQNIVEKFFGPDYPHVSDLMRNVSMIFTDQDHVMPYPSIGAPNIINIGGIHVSRGSDQQLPIEVRRFLDAAENGFIYFSFGSTMLGNYMSDEKRRIFIEAFSDIPYRVIWKWEDDYLLGKPNNVMISKWLPQRAILAHPAIKAFIYQGGLQSTEEAIAAAVPLIGIHLFGDQQNNVNKMMNVGGAIKLDIHSLTKNDLKDAIMVVAGSVGYKQRIMKFRDLLNDRPYDPVNYTMWWIDYVIRHKGAHHLRFARSSLPWYQAQNFDVIGFCFVVIMILLFAIYKSFRWIFHCCCSGNKNVDKLKKL